MATTPNELAERLGTDSRRVRKILRELYRPHGENKHARWILDEEMERAVRQAVVEPR